ncbi:MAG: hypothetical protein K0S40_922 [Actinomycetospora sp.]|jgi:hypothetical protein|nr:hypothetical protein [Actinomycetospora sp.]
MRYMLIMQAPESMTVGESAGPPPEEAFEAMGRYNTELVDAGVLLAAEGLTPSADGFVVTHDGESASVTDGPFAETKELVAGFWILEVASREEAVQWARRCPIGPGVTLEVRRIAELSDLEGIAPAEVLDAEATLRRRVAERDQV